MKKIFGLACILVIILVIFSVLEGVNKYKSEQKMLELQAEMQVEEVKKQNNFDGKYTIDVKTSEVTWIGRKKIITNWVDKGSLAIKSGDVSIKNSLSDWKDTSGKIVFDMTTITSNKSGTKESGGSTKLDTHLKSADFFDVVKFPESSFVLKEVQKVEDGFELVGDLTIKDITKPITLASIKSIDFVEGSNGSYIEAQGSVTFNRVDFGVKYGSESFFKNLGDNIIEDEVTLELLLVAKREEVKK